jgi:protein-disulfide isomerase
MEENKKENKISTPMAIIAVGILITIAIILTQGEKPKENLSLSEQVGVSRSELSLCIKNKNSENEYVKMQLSAGKAMSAKPQDQRGTPYSVIIGPDGLMTEINGAQDYESVKAMIEEIKSGKVSRPYTGNIEASEETDKFKGNANAPITIIEYSDFECPYCKMFHSTMNKIMAEYPNEVKWTYRHFPLQNNSLEKAMAADCVAEIKGNKAFFDYSELLFGLIKTGRESVLEQL